MRRGVFTVASAISMLLFVGVCLLWAGTYRQSWGCTIARKGEPGLARWITLVSWHGDANVMFCYTRDVPYHLIRYWQLGWYGFSVSDYNEGWTGHRKVEAYHRNLACATAVLPVLWVVLTARRRSRLRTANGSHLCLQCGYDLRASHSRCPECGTPIPQKPGLMLSQV